MISVKDDDFISVMDNKQYNALFSFIWNIANDLPNSRKKGYVILGAHDNGGNVVGKVVGKNGGDYVIKNYSKLSPDSKKGEVRKLNLQAHLYDWKWVLDLLGLKPAKIFSSDDLAKMKTTGHGVGGEGKEHKSIKEYICSHPESIGIKKVVTAKTEHDLLSGDRLDVYFECRGNKHIAIEVKPSSSPDYDITRGIFQCVKYQAVMDAARVADYGNYDNEVILVLAGVMSDKNKQLANDLAIHYIEQFNIGK